MLVTRGVTRVAICVAGGSRRVGVAIGLAGGCVSTGGTVGETAVSVGDGVHVADGVGVALAVLVAVTVTRGG